MNASAHHQKRLILAENIRFPDLHKDTKLEEQTHPLNLTGGTEVHRIWMQKRMKQDQAFGARQSGSATKMGQKNTTEKHSYDNLQSSFKQNARSLVDSALDQLQHIFSGDSALGQAINRRGRATGSDGQGGAAGFLDKDQESMEGTRGHRSQIIAGTGATSSELGDQGQISHQERVEVCSHNELVLEKLEPQSSYASSSAHYPSTLAARAISQNQSSSPNRHLHEVIGQTRESSSSRKGSMRSPNQVLDVAALLERLEEKDKALENYSKKCIRLKKERKEDQQQIEISIRNTEAEFKGRIKQLIKDREHREERFQAQVAELIADRDSARKEYEDLVRKQQEESFKQMSTARWLPADDNTVMIDFGRIKMVMRSWAKKNSIKIMARIENLEGPEYRSFLTALSNVAVFENEELPRGLQTPKSPGLILNAILAHHLCTNMFRSPFFFLEHLPGVELLHQIYGVAQSGETKCFHRRITVS
jgi:hypothetical protein